MSIAKRFFCGAMPIVAWSLLLTAAAPVSGQVAESLESRDAIEVDGVVVAGFDAMLSFGVPGVVAEIAVHEGDRVDAGDVLARLDDTAARAAAEAARLVAESDASVRIAEQRLELARLQEGAAREGGGAAVRNDDPRLPINLRLAELEMQRQRMLLERARADYAAADARLRQHTLEAPVAGTIERVAISPGEHASASRPIVRLVNVERLLVEARAPSDLAQGLTVGARAEISAPGADAAALTGRVVWVCGVIDPETDSRLVRVELDGGAPLLPGAHVTLQLTNPPTDP